MARFEGDRVELRRGVSWAAFERFLEDKENEERRVPLVSYLDGVLELMTPSHGHEKHLSWIGTLVMIYGATRGLTLSSYGSWLLKDELRKAGAEPDDCFVLDEDARNPRDRPDIVLEIQWSGRGVNKLEVYRRLRVPEVWFWEKGTIAVYARKGRGAYRKVERSTFFPDLDIPHLLTFIDRYSLAHAIREYQAALAGA